MFRDYSDAEISEQIKQGNKNILVYLFDLYRRDIRKLILKNGGTDADADSLLKEALVKLWSDVTAKDIDSSIELKVYVQNIITESWIKKHDEVDLWNFISEKLSKNKLKKNAFAFASLFLILGAFAWWYFGRETTIESNSENVTIHRDVSDTSKMVSKDNEAKGNQSSVKINYPAKDISTVIKKDTVYVTVKDTIRSEKTVASSNEKSNPDSSDKKNVNVETVDASADQESKEEYIIKKDVLLFTKNIKVIDKKLIVGNNDKQNEEKSLAKEAAEKLNPEAKLPEDDEKTIKVFIVEFWRSPINYKGYKIGKNKIVLYGIDEPDWVKLYDLEGNIYMEYGQNFFK